MDLSDVIGHEPVKMMMQKWVDEPAFAYLFSGPMHVGKSLLAERFVRTLADHDNDKPLDVHPDIIVFLPEEGKKEVSVKAVRAARVRLYERPQVARRMVVYLPRLDWLNQEGFNALLKVVEEPPAGAVFVGVAEQLSAIPTTILSRVVHIPLGIVSRSELEAGLANKGVSQKDSDRLIKMSRGKPGLALNDVDVLSAYNDLAKDFVKAPSLGHRLAAIDAMRQRVESVEVPREAWVNAIAACMEVVRVELKSDEKKALILGQGLIDALRALHGPVGPRALLESAAVLASQEKLVLPSFRPRAYPLSLSNSRST